MAILNRDEDPMTVLIVEDDPDFAVLTKNKLEDRPAFEAIIETRPHEVIDRVSAGEIDCIVSDYEMPKKDGLELLREVREHYPQIPFILYTGKGSEQIASEAISAGATEYLEKEIGSEQFGVLAQRIANSVKAVRTNQWREKTARRQNLAIVIGLIGAISGVVSMIVLFM